MLHPYILGLLQQLHNVLSEQKCLDYLIVWSGKFGEVVIVMIRKESCVVSYLWCKGWIFNCWQKASLHAFEG